ncbi:symmetrical bis(5'-nucleosyl)-tetraphosphatase [Methylomonas paludis]|uniref:bis(5'-nucleosyl)-tetraphosphatase (symmetrical) n=1 Tax=Methylomonas paludis TaxID=1173101 RepID=A0A975MM83_9GAMM|nr:symmetrical bis(5'-nucleosyl)-tetraphosphatase [Methylomonas paludis]QWF70468.1 symmetrical bis(5'-nucleosyl)-tetraphosphatase [Methylomonas paludis]
MPIYAISSVKGDYASLVGLLDKINFNPELDYLWFCGNLINTGPDSLEILRFVKNLGKQAITILGPQELRLLSIASGFLSADAADTFSEILTAPDRDALLKWLRQRALIHHDAKLNFTLTHAGIPGAWTLSQALTFAYEVESVLSGSNFASFLENRRQDQTGWHAKLRGWKRLNFITNAYTLMKYCQQNGKLDFSATGPLHKQPVGLRPWYRQTERQTSHLQIIFADEANFNDTHYPGIYPLPAHGKPAALKLSAMPTLIFADQE